MLLKIYSVVLQYHSDVDNSSKLPQSDYSEDCADYFKCFRSDPLLATFLIICFQKHRLNGVLKKQLTYKRPPAKSKEIRNEENFFITNRIKGNYHSRHI